MIQRSFLHVPSIKFLGASRKRIQDAINSFVNGSEVSIKKGTKKDVPGSITTFFLPPRFRRGTLSTEEIEMIQVSAEVINNFI